VVGSVLRIPIPTTVPISAAPMSGPNRRLQVLSSFEERSRTSERFTAKIGMIITTTAVAGSIAVASAIVPTRAKPKPASPFVVPAIRMTTAISTTVGPPIVEIIPQSS
jgi:hypothetical protein